MRRLRRRAVLWGGLVVGLGLVAAFRAPAQAPAPVAIAPVSVAPVSGSIQDALLRAIDMPFAADTTLERVVAHLREKTGARVVLDIAALDRLEITDRATVRLQIDGVRLKTALRLMLDQLSMTYRVEPEDNLLILTDVRGAEETNERILREIEDLHFEVRDLQDAVMELLDVMFEGAPEVKNPTIREGAPGDPIPEGPHTHPLEAKPTRGRRG
jgi:hypothetical protein